MVIMDFTTGRILGTGSTKIKSYILALCIGFTTGAFAQCDLELLEFNPVSGELTVAFNNTENCGGAAGPTGISELQFGFQALDSNCNAMNQGWDFPWGLSISSDNNHPGWVYSATTSESPNNWTNLDVWGDYDLDPPYYTGDTVTFPLEDFYQSGGSGLYANLLNVFDFWTSQGLGIQAVIWQISYGPTQYAADGGWAEVGANGDGTSYGTGLYEDENFQDNWILTCAEDVPEVIYVYDTVYVDLPPDTIYVVETDTVVINDTIPVAVNWYFYDTTYVYLTDTSYVTLTDTVYLTEYQVDTSFVYEYDMVEVDCNTGQPCVTPYEDCEIYIPNSFTPNNDGVNDVWGAVTDSFCWASWRMKVFSRSGEVVWDSYDPDDIWLGGDEYYVPDGTYIYRVEAEGYGQSYIINGHVTILR